MIDTVPVRKETSATTRTAPGPDPGISHRISNNSIGNMNFVVSSLSQSKTCPDGWMDGERTDGRVGLPRSTYLPTYLYLLTVCMYCTLRRSIPASKRSANK